jgi:hypothetical protein
MASAVLSARTAVISDAGSGLQPVKEIRESTKAKRNSDLHLIAAFYPFNYPPILSACISFLSTMLWNNPVDSPALNTESQF